MNTVEFIKSGILMDYCLGLVTGEEKEKVETYANTYSEISKELRLLQHGLERYAVKKTSWRNEGLKKEIWDAIEKMNNEEKEA